MGIKGSRGGVKRGDVIHGRYEIMDLIGEGGMSRVYLASDRNLVNKFWAVKEVDRRATDPAGRPIEETLASEAALLTKIDHPNIVDIVDIYETDDFIYVVMDHVEGQSLDKVVRANGPQSEEDVQRWILQVCDAVDFLHRQNPPIIYRDMKPNNIMLHPDGYVKLIDFGVSREFKDDEKKDTIAFGTTGYAAPEQYGKAQSDRRTDVYGIGATLWHLLGGEAPPSTFPLPNVRTVNPQVSEGFADVIIPKCTAIDRDDRYQDCQELASDIGMYEELNQEFRTKQKRKVTAFAVSGLLAIVLAFVGIGLLVKHTIDINNNYDSHIRLADQAFSTAQGEKGIAVMDEDYQNAVDEYTAAIEVKPGEPDAWLGLIQAYELDDEFDIDEKKELDVLYSRYSDDLKGSNALAEVAYQIGLMYWSFYSYGLNDSSDSGSDMFQNSAANQNARIKASMNYFKTAADAEGFPERNSASIYYSIADFVTNIDREMSLGENDSNTYQTYFDSLKGLAELAKEENIEKAKYSTYLLIANSLESYVNRFATLDDVSREDVNELWDSVYQDVSADDGLPEDIEVIREAILSKNGSISSKIDLAFSNDTFSGTMNNSSSGNG